MSCATRRWPRMLPARMALCEILLPAFRQASSHIIAKHYADLILIDGIEESPYDVILSFNEYIYHMKLPYTCFKMPAAYWRTAKWAYSAWHENAWAATSQYFQSARFYFLYCSITIMKRLMVIKWSRNNHHHLIMPPWIYFRILMISLTLPGIVEIFTSLLLLDDAYINLMSAVNEKQGDSSRIIMWENMPR